MKINNFHVPISSIVWLVIALILFGLSFITVEPNDAELVLPRANPFTLDHSNQETVQIGESTRERLTVTYNICQGAADSEEPLTEQRYFDNANCERIIDSGESVWVRIVLENTSAETLSDFSVRDQIRGDIPVTSGCWRVDVPLRARPNPDAGWSGGQSGVLPAEEGKAVCIYQHTVSEDAEDPFLTDLTVEFAIGDVTAANRIIGKSVVSSATVLAQEGGDDGEFPRREVSASNFVHINESFSITPELWLPTISGDDETTIAIESTNTGIPIFVLTLLFGVIELVLAFAFAEGANKLFRALVRAAGVYLIFWSFFGHEVFWDYLLGVLFPDALLRTGDLELLRPQNSVIGYAADHLELVIVSSLIIIPLGLFLGIFVTRANNQDYLPLVNNIVNSGQTVPTIAVVAIMAPILGLGFRPTIYALVIYGLLPVLRNTIAGLNGVDPFMKDSARGMGMTPLQILISIELPIASRVIMAGIRTSMVINVGTAALGAYVASGGLGDPIAAGLLRQVQPWVVLGALPAALLAILLDYVLGRVEFVVTPRGLQIEQ